MQHREATLCTDVLQCLTLQSKVSLSMAKPKTHTAVKYTKKIINIAVKKQCLKFAVQNKAVTQTMLEVCGTEQSCNSVIVKHSNLCRPSTNKRKPLHRKQRLKNSIYMVYGLYTIIYISSIEDFLGTRARNMRYFNQ